MFDSDANTVTDVVSSEVHRKLSGVSGPIKIVEIRDAEGNPTGGGATCSPERPQHDRDPFAYPQGFIINWQNGVAGVDRDQWNGATVEDVLTVVKERLKFYQDSKFACEQNRQVITNIDVALAALRRRTAERKQRGVLGTHEV